MRGGWPRWGAAYAIAFVASLASAWWSDLLGTLAFVAGALAILASVGYIGLGGGRKKRVRDIHGKPIARVPMEPEERAAQILAGVRIFLLGLATWAPLLLLALR